MVEMLAHVHISVTKSGDVEITLHLVQVQAAKYATTIGLSTGFRRLGPLGSLLTQGNDIVNVLLAKTFVIERFVQVSCARLDATLTIPSKLMHTLGIRPLRPNSRVVLQTSFGEDAIARGILDVDIEVVAFHLDDDVEIDLHRLGDALFDGKGVRLGTAPPATSFAPEEDEGDDEHGDGPFAAAFGAGYIFGFGFGCTG